MKPVIWTRTIYAPDLPVQWIGWPSWAVWRWAQMFPEDIGYREVEEVRHKTDIPDTRAA